MPYNTRKVAHRHSSDPHADTNIHRLCEKRDNLLSPAFDAAYGRRESRLPSLRIRKQLTNTGFLHLFDLSPANSGEEQPSSADLYGPETVRGQRFANILLNSAKNITAKYNVLDRPEERPSADPSQPGTHESVHVSRAAGISAKLVKANLELKHHCLNASLEFFEPENTRHEGLDGVYNPLQVIRNKMVRHSLHPNTSTYRTLPLACNVFSKHSHGGKTWSMIWGVEINDVVTDFAWRQLNRHRMRNSKGELWFPVEKASAEEKKLHSPLRDKIWEVNDSENIYRTDDILLLVPIVATRQKPKVTKLKRKMKKKAKRLYGSSSHGSSAKDQDSPEYCLPTFNGLPSVDTSGLLVSPTLERRRSSDITNALCRESEPLAEGESKVPKIIINNLSLQKSVIPPPLKDLGLAVPMLRSEEVLNRLLSKDIGSVSDVSFSQVNHSRLPAKLLISSFESKEFDEPLKSDFSVPEIAETSSNAQEQRPDHLAALCAKTHFLEANTLIASFYLGSVYPQLLYMAQEKTEQIRQDVMHKLEQSAVEINEDVLPAQENLYRGFLDETNSLIHLANDEYAVRIDNLLSVADRSYNELNTSMLMDLRRLNEKLEMLNRQFRNGVASTSKDAGVNPLASALQHQALYFVLENTIVVILRLVWVSANAMRLLWVILRTVFFILASLWGLMS